MHEALVIAATTNAPDPGAVRNGFSLLLVLALLGVILVTCLSLIMILRRHRIGATSRRNPTTARLDPWAEAGRRAAPASDDDIDKDEDENTLGTPAG